ncbi:MAG: CpsB/CapC family capsule biosynthesis tyrosine phosphatase [Gaiellaceae bacterium]
MGTFVDCHSHVLPAGDDGAQSREDALDLCALAAAGGTAVLFGTPHVSRQLPLTHERERAIRAQLGVLRPRVPLELRLGFELTPVHWLLAEDLVRYRLEGTDLVLMEVPFNGSADLLVDLAEHCERCGLRPLIAHPERGESVRADPGLARAFVERGWLLQVNATSLDGTHGAQIERLAWRLVDDGLVSVVASDGHRRARPPLLDRAFALLSARVGEEKARPLFEGAALGFPETEERTGTG